MKISDIVTVTVTQTATRPPKYKHMKGRGRLRKKKRKAIDRYWVGVPVSDVFKYFDGDEYQEITECDEVDIEDFPTPGEQLAYDAGFDSVAEFDEYFKI